MKATILVIDDEESIRFAFKRFLLAKGHDVLTASDYPSAIDIFDKQEPDLIFSDIILKNKNGIDLLREIRQRQMTCPVIMITGQPDVDTAAEAVRLGAFDYLAKPIGKETILRVTQIALTHKSLVDEKNAVEKQNQQYRRDLEAIFRSVNEAIFTIDKNGVIINANDGVKNICRLEPESIIGYPFVEISQSCPVLSDTAVMNAVQKQQYTKEHCIRYRHRESPDLVVMLNSAPLIDAAHQPIGTVIVLRDITKLSVLEQELNARHKFHNIIGKSAAMQKIYQLIQNLAGVETTVLVSGESGTGKELVARALHHNGVRASKPFVCVNCSALSENLLESELFGHVKGSFTGAIKNKAGRFEDADGGTVFLDEIGEISPKIQLKLLRVLQEKEFERVGDSQSIKTDVRIITATNRNLKELIRGGVFREDLFYRLKVVEIRLPPLRERTEDIPLLLNHFIVRFNRQFGKQILGPTDQILQIFMNYTWPGNIRELENAIEHAFVMCRENRFSSVDIPVEISELAGGDASRAGNDDKTGHDMLLKTLENCHWNKAKTARLLGISRQTLYRRLKKKKYDG